MPPIRLPRPPARTSPVMSLLSIICALPLSDRVYGRACAPTLRRGAEGQVEKQVLRLELERVFLAHGHAQVDRLADETCADGALVGNVEPEQPDQLMDAPGIGNQTAIEVVEDRARFDVEPDVPGPRWIIDPLQRTDRRLQAKKVGEPSLENARQRGQAAMRPRHRESQAMAEFIGDLVGEVEDE